MAEETDTPRRTALDDVRNALISKIYYNPKNNSRYIITGVNKNEEYNIEMFNLTCPSGTNERCLLHNLGDFTFIESRELTEDEAYSLALLVDSNKYLDLTKLIKVNEIQILK